MNAKKSFILGSERSECDWTPCQNGGKCNNTVDSFICQCPKGWIGKKCHGKKNKYFQLLALSTLRLQVSNGGDTYEMTDDSFTFHQLAK